MITTLLLVGWRPKAYLYLCTLHLLTGWVYVCCRVHNNQEDDRMLVNANVSERTAVRHTPPSLSGSVAQCGAYASIHQPPEVFHAVCLSFLLESQWELYYPPFRAAVEVRVPTAPLGLSLNTDSEMRIFPFLGPM